MKHRLPFKFIVVGVIALVVLAGGGALAYRKFGTKQPAGQSGQQKKKISEPTNAIPVNERPYLQIVPLADGRNLELTARAVNKTATNLEYELEYQSGTLLQGAFGLIDLGNLPATAKILLGSCSAGGACTYHQDVKGGTLLARFTGGDEKYVLKQDWRYLDNLKKESKVSSKDAKFQLDSPELKKQRFIVVYNSPGYPQGLTGRPVSDPYSLTTSGALSGQGKLTIRANEDGAMQIMGYDGRSWQAFETSAEGKVATATVKMMELYVVVKK